MATVDATVGTTVDAAVDTMVDTAVDTTVDTMADTKLDTMIDTMVMTTLSASPKHRLREKNAKLHPPVGNSMAYCCLLYTSPSPRDGLLSRMPSSA